MSGKYSASLVGSFVKHHPTTSPELTPLFLPAERREECQGFQDKKVGAFLFSKKQIQIDIR
ncbi:MULTISPECIES: hypothetical protein [unclassified Pseudomonas]|uniref:hypothetical protein n=1 Tax=unclassified Pseudomonas TaxID=196821 RepID=UPI0011AFBA12|nr:MULTISPECIES: hypothetical protein [unclassified Pseudomonas]